MSKYKLSDIAAGITGSVVCCSSVLPIFNKLASVNSASPATTFALGAGFLGAGSLTGLWIARKTRNFRNKHEPEEFTFSKD